MTNRRILGLAIAAAVALPLLVALDASVLLAGAGRLTDGLVSSTFGAAGAPAGNTTILANGTLAQPQPIGTASGAGNVLHAGFWAQRWGLPTGIDDPRDIPQATGLIGNAPNPFNPFTRIEFTLSQTERVRLEIFDARGALVRTLAHEMLPAGRYQRSWNGTDASGRHLASGVYFYRLTAGDHHSVKKMLLVK